MEDLDGSRRPLSQGDWHVIDQAKLLEDILVRGTNNHFCYTNKGKSCNSFKFIFLQVYS